MPQYQPYPAMSRPADIENAQASIASRTARPAESTCWTWTGPVDSYGYGVVSGSPQVKAHRMAFVAFVGPIPAGKVVDHACRNRACVNPAHLEIVEQGTNVVRGESPAGLNARKTQCVHGHAFTPENTYMTPGGQRQCRSCRNRRLRELRARKAS